MIEKELLAFPLEGNDEFIAEMKTFNDPHKRQAKFSFDCLLNAEVNHIYYIIHRFVISTDFLSYCDLNLS
jgi:hypothetical protein